MDVNSVQQFLHDNPLSLVGIGLTLVLGILFAFCFSKSSKSPPKEETSSKTLKSKKEEETKKLKYFTKEEVAKHNTRKDCWLIIDGKVYDVTPYVDEHMGGDAILNNAGGDSSVGFHGDQHPVKVKEILWEFYIGELKE